MGSVFTHYCPHHCSEELVVLIVSYAWLEGNIDAVIFAIVLTHLVQGTCSWKEILAILMEGYCHAAVCEVECLLYSIAVMDIDVQVQHSGVHLK